MEEESIEHDLEERMYAALHYVDETRPDIICQKDAPPNFDNAQQSTVRRYWRTNENVTTHNKVNTSCNKTNTSFNKSNTPINKIITPTNSINTTNKIETDKSQSKPNEEFVSKAAVERLVAELAIFQQPISDDIKKTIEILDIEDKSNVVELESSDEDEVVEVALQPKPTITIESSDEDDIAATTISINEKEAAADARPNNQQDTRSSPVPSSISSISDEFIRGDCIALNISSRSSNYSTFDYSLQGSDLEQTPSKKSKKRKSKDATSTPIPSSKSTDVNECFATPKSKAKNKKQKTKSYQVTNISIPSADVYDSDSNQSTVETNKNRNYTVTDISLPNTDVYETDSNQSETVSNQSETVVDSPVKPVEVMVSNIERSEQISVGERCVNRSLNNIPVQERRKSIVDLTNMDSIEESVVMANVTGFTNIENTNEDSFIISKNIPSKCGSTRIPAILNEDLDFDNLKGNKVCNRRRYSLTALRAEMEKFYNESWGGENFNHREIQKNMSRDKSLWAIDPKDRMPALARKKSTCNVCNRTGHRDDTCRLKTPICYMCGSIGHYEPRCPKKICVNCGSPNHIYSTMCRNCSSWNSIKCAECGQYGHPASHCPDVWRRYHNTVSPDTPLEENRQIKKNCQMFCSGCTRRGHLVHKCRLSLPFSGLPIYSPYVILYRPVYCPTINENSTQSPHNNNQKNKQQKKYNQDSNANVPKTDRNKRKSKSPIANEFVNKKRNLGSSDDPKNNPTNNCQKKRTLSRELTSDGDVEKNTNKVSDKKDVPESSTSDIAMSTSNHDNKGHIIQDNEVSDTSEVITSARIYITNEMCDFLKSSNGVEWLKQLTTKNNIVVEKTDSNFYISIKGTLGNQVAFQSELRDFIKSKQPAKEHEHSEGDANNCVNVNNKSHMRDNIPKDRSILMRKLNKALESLNGDIGDPKTLYKELKYLQNRQQQLMTQRVVSPQQLSNNRCNINTMVRKLNMILLGQAGLADGNKHLTELYSLQAKLVSLSDKNISNLLRDEIGQHFHCIFTAMPRNDYAYLLDKYYSKSPVGPTGKIRKKKLLKMSPNTMQNNKVNRKLTLNNSPNTEKQGDGQFSSSRGDRHDKARKKLIFLHRRLMNIKPIDSVLKKARGKIMRELYCNITALGNADKMSTKEFKKARKVEYQAQELLSELEIMSHN